MDLRIDGRNAGGYARQAGAAKRKSTAQGSWLETQKAAAANAATANAAAANAAGRLAPGQAESLAGRYNVEDMTWEEYGSLMKELRDSGVITLKVVSATQTGKLPHIAPDGTIYEDGAEIRGSFWQAGGRGNALEWLRGCAGYCRDFAGTQAGNAEERQWSLSIADSYSLLAGIFQQIGEAGGLR